MSCKSLATLMDGRCVDTSCIFGYYFDNQDYMCKQCPGTCISCLDTNECYECAYGYVYHNGMCALCSQINEFTEYNPENKQCQEICGDGVNIGLKECDDGNRVNGDGCDKNCKIENNWACETIDLKDKCRRTDMPTIRHATIDANFTFTFVFSRFITFT